MIALGPREIADAIGARLHGDAGTSRASRVIIDSREAGPGDLFFGIPGARSDGGAYAADVLAARAWGVVVANERFETASAACTGGQVAFGVDNPVVALGALANRWRSELGAKVIGVTGSTGKTSTKDILAALLGKSFNVDATPENLNTEIGMPLTILGAELGTEVLVLEMAMRAGGQIAELARIAEPDVGCIVNIGPVHLEQLGGIEAVAAAKAELLAGLRPGGAAVVPADEPMLTPFLRDDVRTLRFGGDGDVRLLGDDPALPGNSIKSGTLRISTPAGEIQVKPSFSEDYLVSNLLAAVACAQAIGAPAEGELTVRFSALRGETLELLGGVTLINDCYNANPVSMRAALDNLGRAGGRKIAVLGGMAELGRDSDRFHREVANHAAHSGVDLLVAVGDLGRAYGHGYVGSIEHVRSPEAAADMVRKVARPGDSVLVKGSRSVGLEKVSELLIGADRGAGPEPRVPAEGGDA
ncbi:MAG: UDP-N-acetylmuramoyl-tripeptide--D-alanyl-D-alanine ligase [Solirubrobacterales bacterium]